MDGYIIRSGGGVNFKSKEVYGFTIEVNKHVVLMDKLIPKELLYFGRGTILDKVIHIQANIDGWQSWIKVATKETWGIGTGLETHGHKGGVSFFIPMAGATLEAIQGLDEF
eukprot:11034669-Ditylum_brightwellii.AAC.1